MTSQKSYSGKVIVYAIVFALALFIPLALAIPPLPTEFYGRARDYNQNASFGGTVTLYDSSNNLCGTFTISHSGFYGVVTCPGDDPETNGDEGLILGENVTFRYNAAFVTIAGNNTWGQGIFQNVNLTYPVVFCGDLFCDAEYESNLTCPSDCPNATGTNVSINTSINTSTNTSGGGGGGGGSGGSGGGGSGGSGSGGTSATSSPRSPTISIARSGAEAAGDNETGAAGSECEENWDCSEWSRCRVDGLQNRTCTDKNRCGSFDDKPLEVQECLYNPTCSDGLQNGLEEGIDCGGLCPPCISCSDGIQNCHDGKCEEDVDCGGPCKQCPTCYDGVKNCPGGVCEDGIDCGGSCEKACPAVQAPRPLFACQKDFNPVNNNFIIFFILALVSIIAHSAYSEVKVYDLKASRTFTGIERAKKILDYRRREFLFTIIVIMLSIVLYLFYYFFIMCEADYSILWMLLLLLIAVPIVLHETIRVLEYNEMKKILRMQFLLRQHELRIKQLIAMHNENLIGLLALAEDKLKKRLSQPGSMAPALVDLLNVALQGVLKLRDRVSLSQASSIEEEMLRQSISEISLEKYAPAIENDILLHDIAAQLKSLGERLDDRNNLYAELKKLKNHELSPSLDDLPAVGEPQEAEGKEGQ